MAEKSNVSLGITLVGASGTSERGPTKRGFSSSRAASLLMGRRSTDYVGIYGDRQMKRLLRRALKWEVSSYPKRQQACETTSEEFDYKLGEIPTRCLILSTLSDFLPITLILIGR